MASLDDEDDVEMGSLDDSEQPAVIEHEGTADPTLSQAGLQLQTTASYSVDEAFSVDTKDHMDHTFSGIMFDIQAKNVPLVEYLQITV